MSTWNSDKLLDSVSNYRTKTSERNNTDYRGGYGGTPTSTFVMASLLGSMGESIDLYREKDEDGTDSEFEAEEFDA